MIFTIYIYIYVYTCVCVVVVKHIYICIHVYSIDIPSYVYYMIHIYIYMNINIYIYTVYIYTYSYLYSRTYIHTTTHRFFSTVLDQALLDLVLVTFQVLAFNEVLNPCIASVLITAMAQYPWHLLGFHSQIAGIYGMFMQIWNDVYNVFTAQMKYFKSFYRFWPIPILRINLWPTDFHIIPMTEDDSALFQVFRYIVGYNRCNNYLENCVCVYIYNILQL